VSTEAPQGPGFGIDIGGSGIKGAPVDLVAGEFTHDRLRIPTPQPSTPAAVADVVAEIVGECGAASGKLPVGVTFPAVIQHGVARTAANVDSSWIGTDVDALFTEQLGRPVHVINDAETVAKIVRYEERVAIRSDRDAGWINRRTITVVAR